MRVEVDDFLQLMEALTRKYNGSIHTFRVLSEAEAIEAGVGYCHWRSVSEDTVLPCKVLTDDGYVVDLLDIKRYNRGPLYVFSIARVWLNSPAKLEWQDRKRTRSWSAVASRTWQEREARRRRTKDAVRVYVASLLTGKVDWDIVGKAYRPDARIPAATVKKLFHEEIIKRMIAEELQKQMRGMGLDEQYVFQTIKDAVGIAKDRGDAGNMLKGAREVAELLGMDKKQQPGLPPGPGDYAHFIDMADEPAALPGGGESNG